MTGACRFLCWRLRVPLSRQCRSISTPIRTTRASRKLPPASNAPVFDTSRAGGGVSSWSTGSLRVRGLVTRCGGCGMGVVLELMRLICTLGVPPCSVGRCAAVSDRTRGRTPHIGAGASGRGGARSDESVGLTHAGACCSVRCVAGDRGADGWRAWCAARSSRAAELMRACSGVQAVGRTPENLAPASSRCHAGQTSASGSFARLRRWPRPAADVDEGAVGRQVRPAPCVRFVQCLRGMPSRRAVDWGGLRKLRARAISAKASSTAPRRVQGVRCEGMQGCYRSWTQASRPEGAKRGTFYACLPAYANAV